MKKLLVLFSFLILLFPINISAQTDCPIGLINDPAPGYCGSYTDQDGNDICDLSEFTVAEENHVSQKSSYTEEELKQMSVKEMAEVFGISTGDFRKQLSSFTGLEISGEDSMQVLHDNNGLCMGVASAIANDIKNNSVQTTEDYHDIVTGQELKTMSVSEVAKLYQVDASQYAALLAKYLGSGVTPDSEFADLHDNLGLEPSIAKDIAVNLSQETVESLSYVEDNNKREPVYRFWSILAVLLILYLFTYILVKENKIKLLTHRRIWNVLLLVFFLISALSGVLLLIRINFGWGINWPFNLLKYHVETGLAMTLITLFHISWHWAYFTSMLKKRQ
jgi:uncharacterized integral membrane protein